MFRFHERTRNISDFPSKVLVLILKKNRFREHKEEIDRGQTLAYTIIYIHLDNNPKEKKKHT